MKRRDRRKVKLGRGPRRLEDLRPGQAIDPGEDYFFGQPKIFGVAERREIVVKPAEPK